MAAPAHITPVDEAPGGDKTESAIRMLANDLHRLNQSVVRAVEAGVTVELIRSSRHHNGDGNWGDLLVPVIVKQS
ncbi:MAG: hypothetical protein AAGJ34_10040 [Pseudomonadota bacterium]